MQGVNAVAFAATGMRDRLGLPTWRVRRGSTATFAPTEPAVARTAVADAAETARRPGPSRNLARRALKVVGFALWFFLTVAAEMAVMGLLAS